MQVEERFGLKKRHSYDEIVAWLRSEPKGVPYPNRVATQIRNSHVYGQLKDSLRSFNEAQAAYVDYQRRGNDEGGGPPAPFVPPRPAFFQRPEEFDIGSDGPVPPDDDDDDLMGPPGPGPETYGDLLRPAPNNSDQVLLAEGMQPPPPPPPPAPSMMQQAGLGAVAGGLLGAVAGQVAEEASAGLIARAGAAAGFGAAAGAAAGPAGVIGAAALGAMGSMLGEAVAGAVRRGFEPGGGSTQQPSGPAVSYGPGGLQQRIQPNRQEAVNRQQRLHNQGTGAPAAQVDYRTLNGMNDTLRPKDRKVHFAAQNGVGSTRVGVMGGSPSGSGDPITIAATGTSRPATPMDPGGTKISRNADPAPMQQPSYLDLVGKLKQQKAPDIGPVPFDNPITPSRPRARSPRRGDRRPLEVQRRRQKDAAAMFPGGDDRDEALAQRSKTIPRGGTSRTAKRSAEADLNLFRGSKRKATGPADPDNEQRTRRPPPKPEGRLQSRNRIRPEPTPKAEPKAPDQSRNRIRPDPKPKAKPKAKPEAKPKIDKSRNKKK